MSSISAAAAYHAIKAKPSSGSINQTNALGASIGGSSFNNLANNSARQDTIITNTKPLVRPTSKTAQLVRERRARLEVLEQLKCFLCKGYLIDATTIGECMDSFCRSCIVGYLANNMHCPRCRVLIHKTKPLTMLRSDRVLQDIVYKLVPGLYDSEMERRRKFYPILTSASTSGDDAQQEIGIDNDDDEDDDNDEDDADGYHAINPSSNNISSGNKIHRIHFGERLGRVPKPKPFYSPTDSIDISIEYMNGNDDIHIINGESSKDHLKRYLRCPAVFKISQLKKFIMMKFGIASKNHLITVFHSQDVLQDDYTLIDIAYIYDWRGRDPIELHFTKSIMDENDSGQTNKSNQTIHEEDSTSNTTPNKRIKMDVSTLTDYSQSRTIMQVTRPTNFYSASGTSQAAPSFLSQQQPPQLARYILPSFMGTGILNRPTTSLPYSISNSSSSIRPQFYTTTATPVCSITTPIGSNFGSNMVPIMSKCVIQSGTSIPMKSEQSAPQPNYQHSSVQTLNHHTYSRINNGDLSGVQHSSGVKFEPNQQGNNNKNQIAPTNQSQSGSKTVYTSSNNLNAKNTSSPVAFSFVTERGITIVRGANRSGNQTTQTTDIRPTASLSRTSLEAPLKNSGTTIIK